MSDFHISTVTCSICGRAVDTRTVQTDERGRPVHEECYADNLMKISKAS
jgi:hypothetical protein